MPDIQINLPAQGPPGTPGVPGAPGTPGDVGPRGVAVAVRWTHALLDLANGPLIGEMMIDLTNGRLLFERHDRTGADMTNWLVEMGNANNPLRGYLTVVEILDDSRWMLFSVVGTTVNGLTIGYAANQYAVPVNLVAGTVTVLDDNVEAAASFSKSGEKGLDGAGGDMFGAHNLSEVVSKPAAFDTIKQPATRSYPGVINFLPNYLSGLTLSNDAADLAHDIQIAPGLASDAANVVNINLASALIKRLDATWAAGTGAGGLDIGAWAANTWYHVWLMRHFDTGAVDVCFSLSNTAPTTLPTAGAIIPAAYNSQVRRLGAIKTDGNKDLLRFRQYGDHFMMQNSSGEYTGTVPYAGTLITCYGVPPLVVPPIGIFLLVNQCYPQETVVMGLSDPNMPYTINRCDTYQGNTTDGIIYGQSQVLTRVDSSGRVRASCQTGDRYGQVYSQGWIDNRGR